MSTPNLTSESTPAARQLYCSWPQPDADSAEALTTVLDSGLWGSNLGTRARTFESRFAEFQQASFCTTLCNATVGLDAALRAVGVSVGDEVIVPAYTFIATAATVVQIGAIPVFADVERDSALVDPQSVRALITRRTKAIVVVHLAGCPADLTALTALAAEHGLALIEDAAQAHGASWEGRRVGAVGTIGAFSFQSGKNMTAGEGGAVVTDDPVMADRLYSLANVGRVRAGGWYQHESVGYNLRLTEFQAALLEVALERFPAQQAHREAAAARLTERLAHRGEVRLSPVDPRVTEHGRHLFLIQLQDALVAQRDRIVDHLEAQGVPASTGYPGLHTNVALREAAARNSLIVGAAFRQAECPVTDLLCQRVIWLPQQVLLAGADNADAVADVLIAALDDARAA